MTVKIDGWTRSYARCEGCQLLHPEATRVRVRQHVASTGHKAQVVTEAITEYSLEERK